MPWVRRTLACCALLMMFAPGCKPGLGSHIASNDFVHAFTQRDDQAIQALSTESFRSAVWDRIESPVEFQQVAALMGHGEMAREVMTDFDGDKASILMRCETLQPDGRLVQFRLNAIKVDADWRVDDILREGDVGMFRSMRRQAEAVLAVRDLRRGLERADLSILIAASSDELSAEAWSRLGAVGLQKMREELAHFARALDGEVGLLFVAEDGSRGALVKSADGDASVYLVVKSERLVIDDLSLASSPQTLRARVREVMGPAPASP